MTRSDVARYAQAIKDRLTMQEVVARYLPSEQVVRGHYICCPFHGERTPSMRLYEVDYHCFGCGAHGDVLDFVGRVLEVGAVEAARRIDVDYGLGLGVGGRPSLRQIAVQKQADLDRNRLKQSILYETEQAESDYFAALEVWLRLERNKYDYAPTTEDEPWHPAFVEALQHTAVARYVVDEAEARRCAAVGRAKQLRTEQRHNQQHGRGGTDRQRNTAV